MLTVIETPTFQAQAAKIWTDGERFDFIGWIAQNPMAGDVIPGVDGARKLRWTVQGKGKRGGARVIYFNALEDGCIVLVTVYTKAKQENISAKQIGKAK